MKRLSGCRMQGDGNFILYSARCTNRLELQLPRASFVGVLDKRKRLVSIYVIRVRFSSPASSLITTLVFERALEHSRKKARRSAKRKEGIPRYTRWFIWTFLLPLPPSSRSYNHLTCSNARRTRWRLPFIIERHRYYYGGGSAAQFLAAANWKLNTKRLLLLCWRGGAEGSFCPFERVSEEIWDLFVQ